MKQRIAIRLVSLLSLGMLTFAFASACASEQTAFPGTGGNDASITGAGGEGPGTCSPIYCPGGPMGTGQPCCTSANGPCGVNYGMGCVPTMPHRDGG